MVTMEDNIIDPWKLWTDMIEESKEFVKREIKQFNPFNVSNVPLLPLNLVKKENTFDRKRPILRLRNNSERTPTNTLSVHIPSLSRAFDVDSIYITVKIFGEITAPLYWKRYLADGDALQLDADIETCVTILHEGKPMDTNLRIILGDSLQTMQFLGTSKKNKMLYPLLTPISRAPSIIRRGDEISMKQFMRSIEQTDYPAEKIHSTDLLLSTSIDPTVIVPFERFNALKRLEIKLFEKMLLGEAGVLILEEPMDWGDL